MPLLVDSVGDDVTLILSDVGATGPSGTITVGTTTTLAAGASATVTNSGTSTAAVFNFGVPRGATGAAGPNTVTSATTSDGTAELDVATITGDGSGLTGLVSAQITDAATSAMADSLVRRSSFGSAEFASTGGVALFSEDSTTGVGVEGASASGIGVRASTQSGLAIDLYSGGGDMLRASNAGTPDVLVIDTTGGITSLGDIVGQNLSGTNTGDQTTITGNAGTATALQTARTIWGQSFNGTADVNGNLLTNGHLASVPSGGEAGHLVTLNGTAPTVVAGRSAWWSDGSGNPSFRNGTGTAVALNAAGTLTGTTLASNVVTSSLTSVGTLTNLNVVTHIISTNGNVVASSTGALGISSRSHIYSSSDGTFQFRNNANSADASLTAAGITLTGTPLAASSGGTGLTSLGTGIATFLGTPTSANLAAAVTNETGSGSLVFSTSPTLVTPLLGTPTSGTLTNCTGYPELALAGVVRAVATTDLVRTAGVSGADSVLTLALVSGKAYRVRGMVKIVGQTGGTLSSSIGGLNCTFENVLAIRPGFTFNAGASSLTPYASLGLHNATGATTQQVMFDGVIITSASGNFVFSWVSTGASATRAAGSYIEATLLN